MNSLVFAWHELLENPNPFAILASARTPASDVKSLPSGDAHYLLRWSLVKTGVSRRLAAHCARFGFITFSPTELSAAMRKLVHLCFGVLKT